MIVLYELRWSHYCEKIRLALDYMGLPWRSVRIDAFSKREMAGFPRPRHLPNRTVPAILDEATGRFVMDSTPILQYLDETYPYAPPLFPRRAQARAPAMQELLALDSGLGLPSRRACYAQLILETPQTLADLFLDRSGGLWRWPVLRPLAGHALGLMLCQRFSLHRNETEGIYERLEHVLLALGARIETQGHVLIRWTVGPRPRGRGVFATAHHRAFLHPAPEPAGPVCLAARPAGGARRGRALGLPGGDCAVPSFEVAGTAPLARSLDRSAGCRAARTGR